MILFVRKVKLGLPAPHPQTYGKLLARCTAHSFIQKQKKKKLYTYIVGVSALAEIPISHFKLPKLNSKSYPAYTLRRYNKRLSYKKEFENKEIDCNKSCCKLSKLNIPRKKISKNQSKFQN